MRPLSWRFILISLIPAYIYLAVHFRLIPDTVLPSFLDTANLSSALFRAPRFTQRLASTLSPLFKTTTRTTTIRNSTTTTMAPALKMTPRRSEERGHADHGWLKTFHTFSFAMYQDHKNMLHGPLRVINEDRVAAKTGFGTHSHREFEIFSYVVSGSLEHKDSMGNKESLKRGAVQLTSAGTGISHSEEAPTSGPVHFLQIWSMPHTPRLQPKYYTRHFSDEEKMNKFVTVVAPAGSAGVSAEREAKGPAPVQSDLTMYATLVEKGKKVEQGLKGKKGYIHVVQTSGYNPDKAKGATVSVGASNGEKMELKEGDGAYIVGGGQTTFVVENVGEARAEVLLFDLE